MRVPAGRAVPACFLIVAFGASAAHPEVVHRMGRAPVAGALAASPASGMVVVETLDGKVCVPRAEVAWIESRDTLLAAFVQQRGALEPGDAASRLALARWAFRKGLFDHVLPLADQAFVAARAAGDPPPDLPAEFLRLPACGVRDGDSLSPDDARRSLAAAGSPEAPATAAVAARRLQRLAAAHVVVDVLAEHLGHSRSAVRAAAIDALARSDVEAAHPHLLRAALTDPEPSLRRAALDHARATAPERVLAPLLAVLEQAGAAEHAPLRAAILDAIEVLDDPRAAFCLYTHLRRAGAPAPVSRGSLAVLRQAAFVQGFDVDVANSAFIANPQIGLLQSGAVMDAAVLDVVTVPVGARERQRVVRLLERFTSRQYGDDLGKWDELWRSAGR